MSTHRWIDTPDAVAAWAAEIAQTPWIALDTEGNSMFVYRERVCLVQINAGGNIAVIDPLAVEPQRQEWPSHALDPLKRLLEDPVLPVYLHGGENDVAVLVRDYGIRMRGVWDTQQAAALLGRQHTGYGAVVEAAVGIQLDKSWSTYDWAIRPLDPRAHEYALADVVHLPAVVEQLTAAIADADLREEHAIACAAVEESTTQAGLFDLASFWKLKGVIELNPQQLGVLCALWQWRDGIARAANFPAGRIVNGELCLALARNMPTNYQQLKMIGAHGKLLATYGNDLIEVICLSSQTSPAVPPRPRAREIEPVEELRETALKEWRRQESEQRKVPTQVVLPAKALEQLKRHGAGDLGAIAQLGPKRISRYGEALKACCAAGETAAANGELPRRRGRRH